MKRLAILATLAATVSCSSRYSVDEAADYRVERDAVHLVVETPDSQEMQYMAFCAEESSALGSWADSHGTASDAANDHASDRPGHSTYVLWRQRPNFDKKP